MDGRLGGFVDWLYILLKQCLLERACCLICGDGWRGYQKGGSSNDDAERFERQKRRKEDAPALLEQMVRAKNLVYTRLGWPAWVNFSSFSSLVV